jgi:hypothetical protein
MRENALLEALKILRVAAIASLPSLLVDDAPEHASITTKPLEPRRSRRYRGRALITGGIQMEYVAIAVCLAGALAYCLKPVMRSVMQYFLAILMTCALVLPAAAQQGQWTSDDLDLDRPFGDIAVGTANRSQRDFWIFFDNLSSQERAEIRSRCAIIGSDRRFAEWARDLCGQVEQTQDSTTNQLPTKEIERAGLRKDS